MHALKLFIGLIALAFSAAANAEGEAATTFVRPAAKLERITIGASNDPHYTSDRSCDLLNETRSTKIEKVSNGVVIIEVVRSYVFLVEGADPTACLESLQTPSCNSREEPHQVEIEVFALNTRLGYRKTGACRESNDPADTRLVSGPTGYSFVKLRRFETTADWKLID